MPPQAEMAAAGHDADHAQNGQRVGHEVHVQDVQRAATLWRSRPRWRMLGMTQIMRSTVHVLGMKFMIKTFNVPPHWRSEAEMADAGHDAEQRRIASSQRRDFFVETVSGLSLVT